MNRRETLKALACTPAAAMFARTEREQLFAQPSGADNTDGGMPVADVSITGPVVTDSSTTGPERRSVGIHFRNPSVAERFWATFANVVWPKPDLPEWADSPGWRSKAFDEAYRGYIESSRRCFVSKAQWEGFFERFGAAVIQQLRSDGMTVCLPPGLTIDSTVHVSMRHYFTESS